LLEKDKDGNTPLSLAIQNTCSADIVNALLWENPRAASVRDGNGRVPLVLAIDKGVYSYHDVLAHVFAAEPAAVTARDPITALFPFCIAALKTQSDCDDKEQQVSTIYQLLRIDPSVLVQS
jgi:ankyrin repeat protein